jgi:hypothetical protein
MQQKGNVYVAILLIVLGGLFLAFNLVTGLHIGRAWPLFIFAVSFAFFLPPLLWREQRGGLAGLLIPATILFMLALIFTYNILTDDWVIWTYGWILLVFGVGLGIYLAARLGKWGDSTAWVGIWMLIASLAVFTLFATILSSGLLKLISPVILLIAGGLLLLRGLVKKSPPA